MNSELEVKTSKLTKLERKWYKEYLDCFNATDALKRAYPNNTYTIDSVRSLASQTKKSVFNKLNISDNDLMDSIGLTHERLMKKLDSKIEAQDKVVVAGARSKDGKPQIMLVDNHNVQLKATELALKLRGELKDTSRVELTGEDGGPIKFNILAGIGFVPPKHD